MFYIPLAAYWSPLIDDFSLHLRHHAIDVWRQRATFAVLQGRHCAGGRRFVRNSDRRSAGTGGDNA